jgi:hypothetical protein
MLVEVSPDSTIMSIDNPPNITLNRFEHSRDCYSVMEKAWFNKLSIIMSILFILPEFPLFLVGVLAGVNDAIDSIAWYRISFTVLGYEYKYLLGLNGYVIQTSSKSNTYAYNEQNFSFSHSCQLSGYRASIMIGVNIALVAYLCFVIFYRWKNSEDVYGQRVASLATAMIIFILGLAAYANFYVNCAREIQDYLDDSGYQSVHGSVAAGGGCVIAATIFILIIAVFNFVEVVRYSDRNRLLTEY